MTPAAASPIVDNDSKSPASTAIAPPVSSAQPVPEEGGEDEEDGDSYGAGAGGRGAGRGAGRGGRAGKGGRFGRGGRAGAAGAKRKPNKPDDDAQQPDTQGTTAVTDTTAATDTSAATEDENTEILPAVATGPPVPLPAVAHGPPAATVGDAIDAGRLDGSGDDDYFSSFYDRATPYVQKANEIAAPVVAKAKELHAQAKNSWEELETGLDFGVVLAINGFLVLCILWTVLKRCCCPGHRYQPLPQRDEEDDNDLEMAKVKHDIPSLSDEQDDEDEEDEDDRRVAHLQEKSHVKVLTRSARDDDEWDDIEENSWDKKGPLNLKSKIDKSSSMETGKQREKVSSSSRYSNTSKAPTSKDDPDEIFAAVGLKKDIPKGGGGGELATRSKEYDEVEGGKGWENDDDLDLDEGDEEEEQAHQSLSSYSNSSSDTKFKN